MSTEFIDYIWIGFGIWAVVFAAFTFYLVNDDKQ